MLGGEGASCVDVCGSESAVNDYLIETKASASAVVTALTGITRFKDYDTKLRAHIGSAKVD